MQIKDIQENYGTGWISIWRSIEKHWVYKDKPFNKLSAWIDILLQCNHSDKKVNIKNKLIICKRGESLNSLDNWARRWGWNKSKVHKFLILLENDEMIERKKEANTTHLKVCNYNGYQNSRNTDETQKKHDRNTVETQLKLNNNVNNDNNKNNENKVYVHPLQKFIDEKYPRIAKLKQPSLEMCKKVVGNYTDELIIQTLEQMENYKKLNTNYVDAGRTLNNWLQRAMENNNGRGIKQTANGFSSVELEKRRAELAKLLGEE